MAPEDGAETAETAETETTDDLEIVRRKIFSTAGGFLDSEPGEAAWYVHTQLDAVFWGISKSQFKDFLGMVRRSISEGSISNPSKEVCKERGFKHYSDWKFSNSRIGPNMHHVNSGLIRPYIEGPDSSHGICGLSYALKENSKTAGLRCDLFISHAWDEGVFDLEENLMKSWPQSCSTAYFCCLSNPQNQPQLIRHLLLTLEASPFYQVLKAEPKQMLLLSNLNTPIHSRLWCVFEAHCAYEMDIQVKLAGPAEGLITNPKRLACLNCFLQMISVLSGPFFLFSGLAPIIFGLLFLASLPSWNEDTGLYALQFVGSLVLVCGTCFGCKALNSIRNDAASYSLDIRRARCTDDKDRKMLRAEMRGKEQAINAKIRRLIAESGLIADLRIGGRGRRRR